MLLLNKKSTSILLFKFFLLKYSNLNFICKMMKLTTSTNGEKAFQGYVRLNHVKLPMSDSV